jgi:predicted enzyme related to lactoylglutathione lyase
MSTVETLVGRFVWHDHVSGDSEKARRFYADLLGWETEIWKPGEVDYPMIMANGQMHGGFGPAQGGAPAHWLGHVAVESVDDAARRADAAGGSLLGEPMDIPEVGRMAVLRDPQGAVFSLYTSAGDWNPAEGVFVWDELHTSDVEAAKAFYGEVVGWTASDTDMGESGTYTIFESAGAQRAGCMSLFPGAEAPPHWLTYLGTDDVDRTCAKAEELGATKMMGPMDVPEVGRLAVLADPTGAVFGVFKPSGTGS